MENCFSNLIWPFWIHGDTFNACHFSILDENVFGEYLDNFVVCYINDILIFSKNMKEHELHFRLVLYSLKSWKNVNSIKLKWNFLDILYLEMACTWILSRSKPLWIGLPHLFFMMFNVFLDLKTSIDTSMHIIPWQWPLSFV